MANPQGLLVVPIGFRADGTLHALELNNSDLLRVTVEGLSGTVTVQQTTPDNLLTGAHGWDGATWQKLLVDTNTHLEVTNYIRTVSRGIGKVDAVSNLNLAAGVNNLDSNAVPAGHVWVVKKIVYRYIGTIAGVTLQPQLVISGTGQIIAVHVAPASGLTTSQDIDFPLQSGDKIRLGISGATLNDDAYLFTFYEDLS